MGIIKLSVKIFIICILFEASGVAIALNSILSALTLSLLGAVAFAVFFQERS
jgi:uncharacterized membrane-anchored protein